MTNHYQIMCYSAIFLLLVVPNLSEAHTYLFPCDHPLRASGRVPYLFTHCSCVYSEWSEWEIVSENVREVPTSLCNSGEAYVESRRRDATTDPDNCDHVTETRNVCMPDAADKLIMTLGLGNTGQDYSSLHPSELDSHPDSDIFSDLPKNYLQGGSGVSGSGYHSGELPDHFDDEDEFRQCSKSWRDQQVCHHLVKRNKRSANGNRKRELNEKKHHKVPQNPSIDAEALSSLDRESMMQFNWEEHGHRFRRQTRPENCRVSSETQHVLFVLDSSGSIKQRSYNRMKRAIAKLTPLFCKKVKLALITYSSYLNLEFCFNCFDNTYQGRRKASKAIRDAWYQSRATFTGEAVRCICEELLSAKCGISKEPSCLDVVFITDGQSNGDLEVCDEIDCLHRKRGVNTYAIGIENYNQAELNCIADGSDRFSLFEFNEFEDFEKCIDDIVERLHYNSDSQSSSAKSCLALNGKIEYDKLY